MSSDFFKKVLPLFESAQVNEVSDEVVAKTTEKRQQNNKDGKDKGSEKLLANYKKVDDREVRKAGGKSSTPPNNVKENATDFFRKYSDIVSEAQSSTDPLYDKLMAELKATGVGLSQNSGRIEFADKDNDAVWNVYSKYMNALRSKGWHASNIEQSTSPGMKYISLQKTGVTESYDGDDEDPDVKKAMSVKGKDGKKQGDVEKAKKWSFDKKLDTADKNAEDKAAKKVAKDKDLTESKKTKETIKASIKATNDKIDKIVKDGGRVTLTDPLSVKLKQLKKELAALNESWDDDDEDPDVKKAEAVKGKDGKKQGDFEKGKKFDFSKLDKKGEDKAAKKVAKDKDLTESAPQRKWIKNSELEARKNSAVTESVAQYTHIQNEVEDMDAMSPEQLQNYADFIRKQFNSMKSWIMNEFGDTYARLKNDPDEAGHWSIQTCDEYVQELKKAKALGAIIKPSGGAKRSTSIHSDSRGTIGSGSGFTR